MVLCSLILQTRRPPSPDSRDQPETLPVFLFAWSTLSEHFLLRLITKNSQLLLSWTVSHFTSFQMCLVPLIYSTKVNRHSNWSRKTKPSFRRRGPERAIIISGTGMVASSMHIPASGWCTAPDWRPDRTENLYKLDIIHHGHHLHMRTHWHWQRLLAFSWRSALALL